MTFNDKDIFSVMNRSDMSLTILMQPPFVTKTFDGYGVKRDISFAELKAISNDKGGRIALRDLCMIIDKRETVEELMKELGIDIQEEYFYSPKVIKYILKEGELDLLEDTLNFAPMGVVDLIKRLSIELKISDKNKLDMIKKITGSNVEMMIESKKIQDSMKEEEKVKQRKTNISVEDIEAAADSVKAPVKKAGRKSTKKINLEEASASEDDNI